MCHGVTAEMRIPIFHSDLSLTPTLIETLGAGGGVADWDDLLSNHEKAWGRIDPFV